MEITLSQFAVIEQNDEFLNKVEEVIVKTGYGEVTRTVKIQDSKIILEEYSVTTRKKP